MYVLVLTLETMYMNSFKVLINNNNNKQSKLTGSFFSNSWELFSPDTFSSRFNCLNKDYI